MKKPVTNQIGSSMVEMLGVLTILGMVGMAAIKFIGGVHNVFIQNMVVSEARDLQKSISDRYRFEGNYAQELFNGRSCGEDGGSDTVASFICNNKMAPFQMCSGGKLHHKGGGEVKICQHTDNDKYYMIFYNLSDTACAALAQVNWYTRQKSDIYQMVINGRAGDVGTVVGSGEGEEGGQGSGDGGNATSGSGEGGGENNEEENGENEEPQLGTVTVIRGMVVDSAYSKTGDSSNVFPISTAEALDACGNDNNNTVQMVFF